MLIRPDRRVLLAQQRLQKIHPEVDFSAIQHRLLGMPPVMESEVFSSWIARGLHTGIIKRKQIRELLNFSSAFYLADTQANRFNLPDLTMRFNLGASHLLPSMFIFNEAVLSLFQLLSITTNVIEKSPIYRFCPQCLSEDEMPYMCKFWRYAFSYVCQKHGCLLMERCPSCQLTIDPEAYDSRSARNTKLSIYLQCAHCYSMLYPSKSVQISDRLLDILFCAQNILIDRMGKHLPISDYLMQVSYPIKKETHQLYIGIHGQKLFDDSPGKIQSLFKRQGLFNTTHWYPSKTIFVVNATSKLKAAERWILSSMR